MLPKIPFENPQNPWSVAVFHTILPSKFLSPLEKRMDQLNNQISTVTWYFNTMTAKLFTSTKRDCRTMWQERRVGNLRWTTQKENNKNTTLKQHTGPGCFHCAHTRESESRSLQLKSDQIVTSTTRTKNNQTHFNRKGTSKESPE